MSKRFLLETRINCRKSADELLAIPEIAGVMRILARQTGAFALAWRWQFSLEDMANVTQTARFCAENLPLREPPHRLASVEEVWYNNLNFLTTIWIQRQLDAFKPEPVFRFVGRGHHFTTDTRRMFGVAVCLQYFVYLNQWYGSSPSLPWGESLAGAHARLTRVLSRTHRIALTGELAEVQNPRPKQNLARWRIVLCELGGVTKPLPVALLAPKWVFDSRRMKYVSEEDVA